MRLNTATTARSHQKGMPTSPGMKPVPPTMKFLNGPTPPMIPPVPNCPKKEMTPIPIRYGKIQTPAIQSLLGALGLSLEGAEGSMRTYPMVTATIRVLDRDQAAQETIPRAQT